jgi:hypothetical protein
MALCMSVLLLYGLGPYCRCLSASADARALEQLDARALEQHALSPA